MAPLSMCLRRLATGSLVVLTLVAPATGWGGDLAQEVPSKAQAGHDEHRSAVVGTRTEGASDRVFGVISGTWAEVADHYDETPPGPPLAPPAAEQLLLRRRVVGGVGLAATGTAAGVGSALSFGRLSRTRTTMTTSLLTTANLDHLIASGNGQMAAGIILAACATGAAVGSISLFASARAAPDTGVAGVLLPRRDGFVAALGGRW